MTEACVRRGTCRLCGGADLTLILELTPTPPANAFVPAEALGKPQAVFPLDVAFCEGCGHVQLLDVVDPAVLFEDYVYVSGTSPVFVEHFRRYADALIELGRPVAGSLVVDIGSNDGPCSGRSRTKASGSGGSIRPGPSPNAPPPTAFRPAPPSSDRPWLGR